MPRKKLVRTNLCPYHVTARSNNQEWFAIPINQVWQIFKHELKMIQEKEEIIIYQFVLMSNHYHLLLSTPKSNLDIVMNRLQRRLAVQVNALAGRTNHVFGGPYKWSLVKDQHYLSAVIRYIFQNPVRAGISRTCQDYPLSSIWDSLHKTKISGPATSLQTILDFQTWKELLIYINSEFTPIQSQAIKKGLQRKEFKLNRDRTNGNAINFSHHTTKK
ncbi:MAG: hypothetical protein COU68_02870 [Candidatus Pacebacteria bacterium CG10_big_fil_rev_8_21_14_0_10_45_6]|nr:MAG: hypothetical protein COU68_02870 [Candidatus Pacebacteria bacterium CG10_big_fil_rev_8_21_14_0_10_45_6]